MVIDSLELNGGSTMFLEMLSALKKYAPRYESSGIVVSRSGKYGRRGLADSTLMKTYGFDLPVTTYEDFKKSFNNNQDETIVVHHRLQCTDPLYVKCPYIVVNHTVQNPKRILNFRHANKIISVCQHINTLTKNFVNSKVILNAVDNDTLNKISPKQLEGSFRTGRCHRLNKMRTDSMEDLSNFHSGSHKHYIIGPAHNKMSEELNAMKGGTVDYLGTMFDRNEKMSMLKALDLYFYDTRLAEGASMAVLEALSVGVPVMCRKIGGNTELIKHNTNGIFFVRSFDAMWRMEELFKDRSRLAKLKKTTLDDFNSRLHIRHMIKKYVSVFEEIKS